MGADGKHWKRSEEILDKLQHPSWDRIFRIKDALTLGVSINTIHKWTYIDKWFLEQIQELVTIEKEVKKFTLQTITAELLLQVKQMGYSDLQISHLLGNVTEEDVYQQRKSMGINRTYKLVDTCAAEFGAATPYYYSTFDTENESLVSPRKKSLF